MEPSSRILVTLVHGTFAPGAAWTRQDSALCAALRRQIPGASIEAFTWSGRNSNGARMQAARELAAWTDARLAQAQREQSGPIQHYVIAHSHGGNVVLYACRFRSFADHLSKLVCLSTPFLSARARHSSRGILITLVVGIFAAGGVALGLLGVRPWVAIGAAFAGFLACAPMVKWALDRCQHQAGAILDGLWTPKIDAASMLIVRCDSDEASGALTVAQLPTAVASALWGWFDRTMRAMESARGPGAVLAFASLPLRVLMSIVALATLPLFVLAAIPFGYRSEMWGQSLFIEIVADGTPPGTWTVHRVRDFPFDDPRIDGVLRHSLGYEHENALKVVVHWLASGAVPDESSWDVRLWHRLRDTVPPEDSVDPDTGR
jgi:hypothetical protein